MALPFLVESGLDYGHAFQSCAQCGARSTVRFASLFGIGGEYNRNVTEGPISRLIQDSEGITCNHRWELYGDNTGGILRRCRGVGVGATRFHHVTLLEALPTFEGILRERVKRDPSFADRLKNAIQLPYETSSKAMLDELWTAAMDSMDDLDLP